ncbi:MAG: hypothetical protein ABL973_13445 [Micropepsaceae bacterium]
MNDNGKFIWLDPWYPVEDQVVRDGLERELALELSPQHVLAGLKFTLIARRDDCDDALFALQDGSVAEVHLTWRQKPEPDPRWPVTARFGSIDEWMKLIMIPLHDSLQMREPSRDNQ